jgi:hypothetical protein
MSCFFDGDGSGRTFLQMISEFENTVVNEMKDQLKSISRGLLAMDDAYLIQYVKNSVQTQRDSLREKSGFKKLKEWQVP